MGGRASLIAAAGSRVAISRATCTGCAAVRGADTSGSAAGSSSPTIAGIRFTSVRDCDNGALNGGTTSRIAASDRAGRDIDRDIPAGGRASSGRTAGPGRSCGRCTAGAITRNGVASVSRYAGGSADRIATGSTGSRTASAVAAGTGPANRVCIARICRAAEAARATRGSVRGVRVAGNGISAVTAGSDSIGDRITAICHCRRGSVAALATTGIATEGVASGTARATSAARSGIRVTRRGRSTSAAGSRSTGTCATGAVATVATLIVSASGVATLGRARRRRTTGAFTTGRASTGGVSSSAVAAICRAAGASINCDDTGRIAAGHVAMNRTFADTAVGAAPGATTDGVATSTAIAAIRERKAHGSATVPTSAAIARRCVTAIDDRNDVPALGRAGGGIAAHHAWSH
jgi:hypothetical protein